MLCRAIEDRRFHGAKRLAWFAFGDGDGIAGIGSVMRWAGCDGEKAAKLLSWFVRNGHAHHGSDGLFYAEFFNPRSPEYAASSANSSSGRSRPKLRKSKKSAVFARDGNQCAYCGSVDGPFHIDHVHPICRGGSNAIDNLTVACVACNLSKGGKTLSEWEEGNA